jgi:YjbE family integral membrane protein
VEHVGAALFSIIMVNLLLSGDNAVVIGMAVRTLPAGQKQRAMIIGGLGAIVLRVVLTAVAALLLRIPLLQAVGGLVLAGITYRLLAPGDGAEAVRVATEGTFGAALRTIIVADLTMSMDNMLAVAAAAHGNLGLLILGLVLSMAVILAGGSVVAVLLGKLPWLVYAGGAVLLLVAGNLIASDPVLKDVLGVYPWAAWALAGALGLGVAGALIHRQVRRPPPRADAPAGHDIMHV